MIQQDLTNLIIRDLQKLKTEILSYTDESDLWKIDGDIKNSAGNLCLHLLGNLNNFIGAILGNTGYVRKRDDEFGLKNVPRDEMIKNIDVTIETVRNVLPQITDDTFKSEYPKVVLGRPMTTQEFMIHIYGHLNYHLGQVNYHRRLLTTG